jgi:hypothetical protein
MPSPDDSLMLSILKEIRVELRDHRTLLLQLEDGCAGTTIASATWSVASAALNFA